MKKPRVIIVAVLIASAFSGCASARRFNPAEFDFRPGAIVITGAWAEQVYSVAFVSSGETSLWSREAMMPHWSLLGAYEHSLLPKEYTVVVRIRNYVLNLGAIAVPNNNCQGLEWCLKIETEKLLPRPRHPPGPSA